MKKFGLILFSLLLSAMAIWADNDRITSDSSVLPTVSRNFLANHFSQTEISHIKIESNLLGTKGYDVILTNGVNVEFDRSGEWKEIEARHSFVPFKILPAKMTDYLRKNYPEHTVIAVDKDTRDYEIKLNNGIEIKFYRNGDFKEFD